MIRAIIIDDEYRNREALKNLINTHCKGVDIVATADSRKSGLSAINTHNPDVVFLDIEMPDGDGFDLLESIKTKENGIDFEIIFTPEQYDIHVQYEMAIKALKYAALDYLLKPFDAGELVSAVKKVEDRNNNRRKLNNEFIESDLLFFDNAKL